MFRLLACLSALGVVVCLSAQAHAQGYDGLFGDDGASSQAAPRNRDEPPGYQGLIPGTVPAPAPSVPAQQPQTTTAVPQRPAQTSGQTPAVSSPAKPASLASTPAPLAQLGMTPIRTSDDLRKLAMIYSVDKNLDDIPDAMAAQFRLPETSIELLKQPRTRINGMLPMELGVKNGIDNAMSMLAVPGLRPADKQARAKLALDSLKNIQLGLKVKSQTPDKTYQVMGLPPLYVKEEREAIAKSLARVDAAIKLLEK